MKIGYSKTFPVIGKDQWEKIWIEDEVQGTEEDARKALYGLKKQVESFHYESNKAAEKQVKEPDTPQSTEAKMIGDILLCKNAKDLSEFKFLAEKQKGKFPEIWAAYQMMEKKLNK